MKRHKNFKAPEKRAKGVAMRVKKLESIVGNLYTFSYTSKTATLSQPIIISVRRNNQRRFKAKNGNFYMAGISLEHTSDTVKSLLVRNFSKKGAISYADIQNVQKAAKISYRIYNMKYVKNLIVVYPNIYLEQF